MGGSQGADRSGREVGGLSGSRQGRERGWREEKEVRRLLGAGSEIRGLSGCRQARERGWMALREQTGWGERLEGS